jgi:NAD+ kinase
MRSVERIAILSRDPDLDDAVVQVAAIAERLGIAVVEGDGADLAVVLGGDGTMLRALTKFLGTGVPVIGVNFGRVGFLTAIPAEDLRIGLERVLNGEYQTVELATLEALVNGSMTAAVNDVVVASATLGRMVELGYSIGGEDLGHQPCDGLICATPTGSTAYNLSNGGPVLVWGLDAMALTFVAPHALVIRPLVVPRSADVTITNLSDKLDTAVLVDGHRFGSLAPGEQAMVRIGDRSTVLATLPEVTFFTRYAVTFGR